MASMNGISAKVRKMRTKDGEAFYQADLYAKGHDGPVKVGEWTQGKEFVPEAGFSKKAVEDALSGDEGFAPAAYDLSVLAEYESWYRKGIAEKNAGLGVAECAGGWIGRYLNRRETKLSPEELKGLMAEESAELSAKYPGEGQRFLTFARPTDFIVGEPVDADDLREERS